MPEDLWRLRSAFGLSFRFRSLSWTCRAAQMRVFWQEAGSSGGLRAPRRLRQLSSAISGSIHIVRRVLWRAWYDAAPSRVLVDTQVFFADLGLSASQAYQALSKGCPRPWPRSIEVVVKRNFQKWFAVALEQPAPGWAEQRLRHKLTRWRLAGFPGRNARLVHSALQRLPRLVPPRVQCAVLSTLFNRWTTARRFQRPGNGCLLGCGGDDSIEHYLRCSVLHSFASRRFCLNLPAEHRWPALLLTLPHSDLQLSRIAIFHYVAYRAVNIVRRQGPWLRLANNTERDRLLQQVLVEAVRSHPAGRKIRRLQ